MQIYDYHTVGGKNVILDYIDKLPKKEKAEALSIRKQIRLYGLDAFEVLSTRQLYKKVYEIKYSQERIMYVIQDADTVHFLHMCKKQKQKAEKYNLEVAIKRAKEIGLL